jgi:hypothetical protein
LILAMMVACVKLLVFSEMMVNSAKNTSLTKK